MFEIEVKITISDDIIQEVIDELHDWYALVVKPEHVQRILEMNLDLAKNLQNMDGVDTLARGDLADLFCRDILGMSIWKWPTGIMSAHYKNEFYKTCMERCKEKEINFNLTEDELKEMLKGWIADDEKRHGKA